MGYELLKQRNSCALFTLIKMMVGDGIDCYNEEKKTHKRRTVYTSRVVGLCMDSIEWR